MTEILCRSAKHYFRQYIQSVPMHLLSYSISHFLNCFLTILASPSTDFLSDEFSSSSIGAVHNGTTNTNASVNNSSSQKTNNKKKNKKQQRKQNPLMRNGQKKMNDSQISICCVLESLDFSMLTSKILWSHLATEAKSRFNYDLNW